MPVPSPEWYEKWVAQGTVGIEAEREAGVHLSLAELTTDEMVGNATCYWYDHLVRHHGLPPFMEMEGAKDRFDWGETPDGKSLGAMTADEMKKWHDANYGEHAHGHHTLLLGAW